MLKQVFNVWVVAKTPTLVPSTTKTSVCATVGLLATAPSAKTARANNLLLRTMGSCEPP